MTDVSKHFFNMPIEMPWKRLREDEMPPLDTDFENEDENLDDVPDEDVSWEMLEEQELDSIYKDDDDEYPRSS